MTTEAESTDIPDDWVMSKIDHSSENPNFGFVETLYQTCSAALISLWKSHFRLTIHNGQRRIMKEDIASIQFWDENFPSGYLDAILAESSGLKIRVLENLMGIGKILIPFFTDYDEGIFSIQNECNPEQNFASDLEIQVEKAALMLDVEERSESSSDDETSDDSSSPATERHQNRLGRLHSYISCLIDLSPVVERYLCCLQCKAEAQYAPIETVFRLSHRAQPYAILVRDRFANAPTSLIERLAEANLERSIRVRTQDTEVYDHTNQDAATIFKPSSLFHDSGLGTSIPTMSEYAATVASHTSFLSVAGEDALGRPRVPPLPREGGRPFQCNYCHRTIFMRNRIEWKMHVFADLESYICTHDDCRGALKTFPTRQLWADHEFNEHFTLLRWRCFPCNITFSAPELFVEHLAQAHGIILTGHRLTAITSEARETILTPEFEDYKCPLCLQNGWSTRQGYVIHVGGHLEEISLACLPRDEENSPDDGLDTDISNNPGDFDGPTSSNGKCYEVDADSKAQYEQWERPVSTPEPILTDWASKEREDSEPGVIIDTGSPKTTSPQDISSALFPGSSLSNEQSAGSESVRPNSFWSVAEKRDFKLLLAHFGEDFEGISRFMKTKTPAMVRSYLNQRLVAGETDLKETLRDAEARKLRGKPQHPVEESRADEGESNKSRQALVIHPEERESLCSISTGSKAAVAGSLSSGLRSLTDDRLLNGFPAEKISDAPEDPSLVDSIENYTPLLKAHYDANTTSDNVGVPSQGAQSTLDNNPLRDVVRRAMGPSATSQSLSNARQTLQVIRASLDEFLAVQNSVDGKQMPPPSSQPSVNEPKTTQRKDSRVLYLCLKCGKRSATKHVFKRHVENMHYPRYDYHCHLEYCTTTPLHRRDKLREHYASAHGLQTLPSPSTIDRNKVSHLCPPVCALCSRPAEDWDDFYDCFVKHCEVKPASSK